MWCEKRLSDLREQENLTKRELNYTGERARVGAKDPDPQRSEPHKVPAGMAP